MVRRNSHRTRLRVLPASADGRDLAPRLAAELGRVGDGHGLVLGVDVDRRDIELEVRVDLLAVDARDAGDGGDVGDELEAELDPVAVLAFLENVLLAVDVDAWGEAGGLGCIASVGPGTRRRRPRAGCC